MNIPPWVLEGTNGALAWTLLFVCIFQVAFLVSAWLKIRGTNGGERWACSAYRQTKPVIALTMMALGLLVRVGDIWLQRFAENQGLASAMPQNASVTLHVAGTTAIIVGFACWLRVTMPKFCRRWAWAAIVAGAVLVGISPLLR